MADLPNPNSEGLPVSAVARRIGPPLAAGGLVVTVALLAWMTLAPTAIAGPLSQAPFTVSAILVVPPGQDGCLHVVEGGGAIREHCIEELAAGDDEPVFTQAYFDDEARLLVGEPPQMIHLDPVTGDVLGTVDQTDGAPERPGPPRPAPEEAPIEVPPAPPADLGPAVYVEGDRVLRWDEGPDAGGEVVLDLGAPPGYRLVDAVLSPDGRWVVVRTPRDELVVAPTDGSAAPHVWAELPSGHWADLHGAIRWDS